MAIYLNNPNIVMDMNMNQNQNMRNMNENNHESNNGIEYAYPEMIYSQFPQYSKQQFTQILYQCPYYRYNEGQYIVNNDENEVEHHFNPSKRVFHDSQYWIRFLIYSGRLEEALEYLEYLKNIQPQFRIVEGPPQPPRLARVRGRPGDDIYDEDDLIALNNQNNNQNQNQNQNHSYIYDFVNYKHPDFGGQTILHAAATWTNNYNFLRDLIVLYEARLEIVDYAGNQPNQGFHRSPWLNHFSLILSFMPTLFRRHPQTNSIGNQGIVLMRHIQQFGAIHEIARNYINLVR
jgi:hypothetical protein